jgi:hypothetical protein
MLVKVRNRLRTAVPSFLTDTGWFSIIFDQNKMVIGRHLFECLHRDPSLRKSFRILQHFKKEVKNVILSRLLAGVVQW